MVSQLVMKAIDCIRTGGEDNCGAGSVDGSGRVKKLHSVVFNGFVWPTQSNLTL